MPFLVDGEAAGDIAGDADVGSSPFDKRLPPKVPEEEDPSIPAAARLA